MAEVLGEDAKFRKLRSFNLFMAVFIRKLTRPKVKFSMFFYILIILVGLLAASVLPAYSQYNQYNAHLYKNLADKALSEANYWGAVDLYNKSLHFHYDLTVEQESQKVSKLATESIYYLNALKLFGSAKSLDEYNSIKGLLAKVSSQNMYYAQAQQKIAICDQNINQITLAQQAKNTTLAQTQNSSQTKDSTRFSTKSGSSSSKSIAPNNTNTSDPYYFLSAAANHRCEESWNEYCLNSLGDAQWTNFVKQALTTASGSPPEDYQVILDHAKYISKIDYVAYRDQLIKMYQSLPGGLSGTSDWIMVSIITDNGVNPITTTTPIKLAMIIFHEALHGERPEFSDNNNQQMKDWETNFRNYLIPLGYYL